MGDNRKIWCCHEIEYLKSNYCEKPISELSAYLNRTKESIESKANRLGLKKTKKTVSKWTDSDICFLREYYPDFGASFVAKKLNKTVRSIEMKAYRLKIERKINFWTEEHICFLEDHYRTESIDLICEKTGHSKKSVYYLVNKLGLTKTPNWSASEDELLLILFDEGLADQEISIKMNRTISSIENRRKFIGATKSWWTDDEKEWLKKYYCSSQRIEIEKKLNRNWGAIVAKALELGLSRNFYGSSYGEETIALILDRNDIKYQKQYGFEDLRDKKKLKFDFAVFDSKFNLLFLIEYDGIQHFKPVKYFGGESAFRDQKRRDSIKNEYCRKNEILLHRVPYYKIEDMEAELLKKYKEVS